MKYGCGREENYLMFDVRSRACGLVDLEQVGTTSYTETTLLLRIERPAAAAFKGRCLLLLPPLSEAFMGGNGGGQWNFDTSLHKVAM